jgi:hypothetical protein
VFEAIGKWPLRWLKQNSDWMVAAEVRATLETAVTARRNNVVILSCHKRITTFYYAHCRHE